MSFLLTTQKVTFVTLLCISLRKTCVFWGITGQGKISNTHDIFFMTFWCVYNMMLYAFCPGKMCYVWDSVIYIIAEMNSKLRCVYKFVTYINLCKSRGDFDITHVFLFDRRKGDILWLCYLYRCKCVMFETVLYT